MKMKKLLSIGAISLVLASSTSIGASAAEMPSKTDMIIKIIANQYINGENETGLLTGVDKDTKIGTVVNDSVINAAEVNFGSYKTVDKVLTKFEKNKDYTVVQILQKATKDAATFEKFKADFIKIATKVQAMDAKTGSDRESSEKQVIAIVKAYDKNLAVTFGKDSTGKTTASVYKAGTMLIQFTYDDVQKVIDKVNDFTWNDVLLYKSLY